MSNKINFLPHFEMIPWLDSNRRCIINIDHSRTDPNLSWTIIYDKRQKKEEKKVKKFLYIMTGIPGSGKSTCAKAIAENCKEQGESVQIVSRDAIRFSMVREDEPYFSKENEVFAEFIRQINESLVNNSVTIVDATHLSKASRFKVLNKIVYDEAKAINVIFVKTNHNFSKAKTWNEQRTGRERVPEDVLRSMWDNYESPGYSEQNTIIEKMPWCNDCMAVIYRPNEKGIWAPHNDYWF